LSCRPCEVVSEPECSRTVDDQGRVGRASTCQTPGPATSDLLKRLP
jgi:hypothetical protein